MYGVDQALHREVQDFVGAGRRPDVKQLDPVASAFCMALSVSMHVDPRGCHLCGA